MIHYNLTPYAARFFYGHPVYSDLPRKHKITIAACADRCNAPEINCIALVGALSDGEEGFAVRVPSSARGRAIRPSGRLCLAWLSGFGFAEVEIV
ncbi:MAG: hypothetical protein ACRDLA_11375 [Thermoleophilaceae bacterium]